MSEPGSQSLSSVGMPVPEVFRLSLSAGAHTSVAFSCADKLLCDFADQLFEERELAIAYPCLGCRGGLTLFLSYLTSCVQTDNPGRPFDPVLVYPGTAEIRESYMALQIRVGDLLEGLGKIRILAYARGGSPGVYPWEEQLLKRIDRGQVTRSDEYPLHDFFPAAILDGDAVPHVLGGRHGFGRNDDSVPPLHFAVKLHHVSPHEHYRSAFLMHDALTTYAERRRLNENLHKVSASTVIHLFESPFSPNFRKLVRRGVSNWRLRPSDFPEDGELFLDDVEALGVMDAMPRLHALPSHLDDQELYTLHRNFRNLRQSARGEPIVANISGRLYDLFRFFLTLPVPIEDHDAVATDFGYSTVQERLADIREGTLNLGPVDYASFDESLQTILNMEDRLREDPARARAILAEVLRARSRGLRIGIVIPNELLGAAIERFLARSLRSEPLLLSSLGVHVVHIGSLRTITPENMFDLLVFPSYRGGNALRWIMSGKAKEAVIISTEAERRAMLRDFKEGTEEHNAWTPRRKGPPMLLDDGPEDKLVQALSEVNPVLPTIPLDDERFLQAVFDHVPRNKPDTERMAGSIRCLKVMFRQQYAFLPEEGTLTVIEDKGTTEKAVKALKPGDIVLFVDHAQSRTIYDLMLDEIKRSPGFEPYVTLIQQWHRRLQSWFVNSGLTYAELHKLVVQKGSKVVEATLASWVRGNTMAPFDPEDLRRMIAIVGIEDPNGSVSEAVNDAAVRLRNVYRVYAKAVNAFLIKTAGEDRPEVDDLLLKYNLDIFAIRDSVMKEEVRSLSSEIVNVSSSVSGRLYGD